MTRPLRHLAGLALALLLAVAAYQIWMYVPRLIGGTLLQDLGLAVTFTAIVALLSLGELLWVSLSAWLSPKPGDPH
jgi:hypothetical protein